MKRKLTTVLAFGVVCAYALTGCGSGTSATTAAPATTVGATEAAPAAGKIAFVTGTGGLGDKSFNDLGYEGIKRLMAAGVTCDVAEPSAIAEMEGILRNFSEKGEYALIVGMGGDMVDSMVKVAADYPDQNYLVIDGSAGDVKNIRSVIINQEDTAFLVGAYAGLMALEGNLPGADGRTSIGVVGGMDIPLIRGIQTAYECGARYVNPGLTVQKAFVGGWSDPATGSELATGMFENGALIVFQAAGGSGMGVLEAAQKTGLYAIGYDGNQNGIAPDNIIGSGVRGLDAEVENASLDALAGKFVGGDISITMKDENTAAQIALTENNIEVPQTVLDKLEKIKAFLVEAKVAIPTEPEGIEAYLAEVGSLAD
ncbi:MAG: BMP family ABC transporter substrate-binding protein [Lachnospiraceae bacterium]|jgi:basic membrane protein A|nr:BMP family ABC transporter substrate-binding protein [Lachnospiraceae bacterium]